MCAYINSNTRRDLSFECIRSAVCRPLCAPRWRASQGVGGFGLPIAMQRLKQNVELDLQSMGLAPAAPVDEPPEVDPFDRAMSDRIDRVVAEAVMKAKSSRRGGEETTPQPPDPAVEALVSDTLKLVEKEAKPSSPFRSRDFIWLFLTNVSEFCGATLAKLSTLQFLYEETGSGVALGALGFVMLLSMVPATLYGGVLADQVDRKRLVAVCMAVCCAVSLLLGVLEACGLLRAWHIFVATAGYQARRLIRDIGP